jgi:Family of unknown function (DUF6281)
MADETHDSQIATALAQLPIPDHDRDVVATALAKARRRRRPRLRPPRGRRLAVLAAALLAVAAASAALALVTTGRHHQGSESPGSCALAVRFDGIDYLASTMKQPLQLGRTLGQATLPPCPDFNNPDAPPAAGGAVEVAAIAGVPPAVALGAPGDPHTAYLAPGYFPELPSYPLDTGAPRDYTDGCHITGHFSLTATVSRHASTLLVTVTQPSGSLETRPGSTIQLLVDARTHIDGFEENGLPYLTTGDRLRASGVTCQFQGTSSPAVIARAIAPAG